MRNSVLPPRPGTQPDTLSSQLHEYETNDDIHDFHWPTVETTIPRADSQIHNLTTARMLFKVYRFMLPLVFSFSMVFVIAFYASTMPTQRRLDDSIPIEEIREDAPNRLSYTIALTLTWHHGFYMVWMASFSFAFIKWNGKRIDKLGICLLLLTTLFMLGLMVFIMSTLDNGYDVYRVTHTGFWRTGVLPTSPSVCGQRLEEKQRVLLSTDYYSAQFGRAIIYNATDRVSSDWPWVHLSFNETRFLQIHKNPNICFQGFEGNQDLYGLGVRLGIYLHWITAFMTNNFLPAARQSFRVSWMVFSIAMCMLAFVASIADYCIFGIEIEVLYWLYWGGFACVCASAPSQTRLAGQKRWVGLDWDIGIHYTMHTFMACHGLWFSWWGYDQIFARFPCGTYQFIFAKFLDPSVPYCYARDVLSAVLHSITIPLLLAIPFAIIVMAAELKGSIKDSAVYRMVFCCANVHTLEQGNQNIQETDESISNGDGSEHRLARLCNKYLSVSRSAYYMMRRMAGMPEHRLGGIRLITPLDVRHRRHYRIGCLMAWLVSFSISVTAIETTLAWNRVTSVHSLASLGQMLAFMLGAAPFISVLWTLFKQELRRRQDAKRRTIATDDMELDTLPPLPLSFSGAIQSAFRQPDEGFLTNAAALPHFTTDIRYADAVPDNDPYMMSGGAGPGRQSMDTTSEIKSSTETGWERATEGMSSVSDLPIDRGTEGESD